MTRAEHVRLGFEVGSGEPVDIPIAHMVVTGQTQLSGKTTTLEALISRAQGWRALAFVTKRGEGSFDGGRPHDPYFRERADWQFVESILESAMRQKMRFERAWIVKAARGARTLADVRRNVKTLMTKSKRSMDQDIFMLLGEYLDLVVPLIAQLPDVHAIELRAGLNVMNLGVYPTELQQLVIRSAMEWIYEREENVLTVVPEAWEFIPQERNSPVKLAATALARKGAGLHDFMWIDSQDLAGIEKEIVRQCSVYLLGVQREANEIKRTLAHIPAGIKKPKADDLATLGRGQFWACWGREIRKVYVWPEWGTESSAREHAATGRPLPHREPARGGFTRPTAPARPAVAHFDGEPPKAMVIVADSSVARTRVIERRKGDPVDEAKLEKKLDAILDAVIGVKARDEVPAPPPTRRTAPAVDRGVPGSDKSVWTGPIDDLYREIRSRLVKDAPALLKVLKDVPELTVVVTRRTITADGSTLRGRLAGLVAEGFFEDMQTVNAAWVEVKRRGFPSSAKSNPNVYKELDWLAEGGFLTKEAGGFLAVEGAKIRIEEG